MKTTPKNTAVIDQAIREVLDAQDDVLTASHRLRLARDAVDRITKSRSQVVESGNQKRQPQPVNT